MSHSVKVLQIFDRKLFFCGPKIVFWLSTKKKYLIYFNILACLIIEEGIVFACVDSYLLGSWIR